MIRGVIFDLDGVLVSTDQLHFQAWSRLAQDLKIADFTKEDNEHQRGVSRMASLEIVLGKGKKIYSYEEKLELAEKKNDYYVELLWNLTDEDVLAGVRETLTMLRKNGIFIGVGSVSKNTPLILQKTQLASYIDQVSCGLDITRSKPDPEVFLIGADKLGLQPEECLVVEDSYAGILAARAANMKSLGVGPRYQQLGADYSALSLKSDIDWKTILMG